MNFIATGMVKQQVCNTAQTVLDSYTVTEAIKEVDAIKSGNNYSYSLDQTKYCNMLQDRLGIGSNYTGYDRTGAAPRVAFQLKNIKLTYSQDHQISSQVTFTYSMPVYFMQRLIRYSDSTVVLYSKFDTK